MAETVFFVTGASSGFGKHISLEALKRGHKVVATARSASSLGEVAAAGAHVMALDVTADEATLAAKLDEAAAVYGGINHVVNAAGYPLEGAVEEASQEETAAQFNTNVFGCVNITRAAAPHLRAAAARAAPGGGGRTTLVHFGSLVGWRPTGITVLYSSTKAAVSALCEGLRSELGPLGVDVCTVEPGMFRTEFLSLGGGGGGGGGGGAPRRIQTARRLGDVYGPDHPTEAMRRMADAADGKQSGDPALGAVAIVDVLTGAGRARGRAVPPRLVLGSDCVAVVRAKCAETLELLKEWEDVSRSTDY